VGKDALAHQDLEGIERWKAILHQRVGRNAILLHKTLVADLFSSYSIQSVHDAQKCVELGCDGIVVSNHAGRQVDGAIASLDALENIINAGIGEKLTVMFDSGVRGASDVIKALCLGAKFVWVGRMWIYGLR